ncbi:MAG: biotin transporter BioY [Coriobacteriia bacterium]|nr:biotin transporter BioY [Coriobacteriia bacterium]
MSDTSLPRPVPSDARRVATTALLAALLSASALLSIPTQPVPVTLQVLVVVLIALLVPPRWAAFSVATYLVLGSAGLPVFAGFRGGLAVLLGPTGGFLSGFLVGAVAGAWTREMLERTVTSQVVADAAAALVVIVVVYGFGWQQLAVVTGMGSVPALLAGVVPFVLPDAVKAAVAVALAAGVRRAARI